MHPQSFLMFKSNPFKEEFQRYDGKFIRTLQIQNFSFFSPIEIEENSNRNKIYLKNSKHTKAQNLPIEDQQRSIYLETDNCGKLDKKISTKKPKHKHNKGQSEIFINPKTAAYQKSYRKKQFPLKSQRNQKKIEVDQTRNTPNTARLQKLDFLGDTGFSSFPSRTINQANEIIRQQRRLKQKLYQSIDFDNLFQKIQSQVTHYDRNRSPQNQTKMKEKLILLDKMKRYSKTPSSKARTVFDQFNLKYLINKRKNFNIKNESTIKGSHLPYFQSFNSTETKIPRKNEKRHEIITSMEKSSQKSPDLSPNHGQSRRKISSFIVIDDHGIVHEENPECNTKDRAQMIQKISGKMINMRQMLKIEKIQPSSPR